jgi:hypothetical protein
MKKAKWMVWGVLAGILIMSCNNGLSSARSSDGDVKKRDRSQRTVIDNQEYFDFTTEKYNAKSVKIEDMLYTLNNGTFKNGNSVIKIKTQEGVIEISSDEGIYNGKDNCQIYGKFPIEARAASSDCLYIRKDPHKEGYVLIDGVMFNNEAVPELAVCLPLYGYSRNRIEVSSIMDGFIVMPSGTYWR